MREREASPGARGGAGGQDATEQRARPRAPFDGWVELQAEGRRQRVTACDLSSDGIGLRIEDTLPALRTPVSSEFALPGIRLPVVIEGVVAWRDPSTRRVGVRFVDLDPALGELIESFAAGRL